MTRTFRGFKRMGSGIGSSLIHPKIRGRITLIHQNCGFPSTAAFDAFFSALNAHLCQEWPEYEDTRRLTLFTRALAGDKITRAELVGPHIELAHSLPAGGL